MAATSASLRRNWARLNVPSDDADTFPRTRLAAPTASSTSNSLFFISILRGEKSEKYKHCLWSPIQASDEGSKCLARAKGEAFGTRRKFRSYRKKPTAAVRQVAPAAPRTPIITTPSTAAPIGTNSRIFICEFLLVRSGTTERYCALGPTLP